MHFNLLTIIHQRMLSFLINGYITNITNCQLINDQSTGCVRMKCVYERERESKKTLPVSTNIAVAAGCVCVCQGSGCGFLCTTALCHHALKTMSWGWPKMKWNQRKGEKGGAWPRLQRLQVCGSNSSRDGKPLLEKWGMCTTTYAKWDGVYWRPTGVGFGRPEAATRSHRPH